MSSNTNQTDKSGSADQRSSQTLIHRTDLVLAIIILSVTIVLFYATTQFDEVSPLLAQNVGPELFPRILLIVIFALTLTIPLEHLFLKQGAAGLDKARKDPIKPITWQTIVLSLVIVGLMPYLGTLITMVAISVLLPVLWGERRLRVVAPFAIIFPAVVTILFSVLLKVHFIPGLLEYIL